MSCQVAEAFISSEKDFEIYNKYILCMYRVQKTIDKTSGDDKIVRFLDEKFAEIQKSETLVVDDPNQKERKRNMTMESLIIKPLQRVMLYPLLLEKIHSACQAGTQDEKLLHGT